MISFSNILGDRLMTEWTVRRRVDQASLWKTIITLVVGSSLTLYLSSLHLENKNCKHLSTWKYHGKYWGFLISGSVLLRGMRSLARRLKLWILNRFRDLACSWGSMCTGSPNSPWSGWGLKLFWFKTWSVKLGKAGWGRVSPTKRPTTTWIPRLSMYSLWRLLDLKL